MEFSLRAALSASMVTVVFVLFFIDLFDSAGTLTSIANVTGKINSKGEVEDIDKALVVDSGASVFGGIMGTTDVYNLCRECCRSAARWSNWNDKYCYWNSFSSNTILLHRLQLHSRKKLMQQL